MKSRVTPTASAFGCVLAILLLLVAPVFAADQEEQYYAIFMSGQKIGYAHHVELQQGQSVTHTNEMRISIDRAGIPLTVQVTTETHETMAGEPLGFKCVQDMGMMAQSVEGVVERGVIRLSMASGDTARQQTMPWPAGAVMDHGRELLARKMGLSPGATYAARIFDPSSLQAFDVTFRVGAKQQVDLLGRVVELTEISSEISAGPGGMPIRSTSYVDADYKQLKQVMPMMGMAMEIVACDRQFALSPDGTVDFLAKLMLSSPRRLGNLAKVRSARYRLVFTGQSPVLIPSSDNQSVEPFPGGAIVTVHPASSGGGGGASPTDPKWREALAATRYLQSDHPEIVALARRAAGQTSDPARAARNIEKFVAAYIELKDLSVGYATALEVARSRQGDCSEHAVLVAALCRAAGIPARMGAGVAYIEGPGAEAGTFGPHAWAEAYLEGKWVGLDAALPGGFDAGHIALAYGDGGPAGFFNVAMALGNFSIEDVSLQQGPGERR